MESSGLRPFWTEPNLVYVHLTGSRRPDLTEVRTTIAPTRFTSHRFSYQRTVLVHQHSGKPRTHRWRFERTRPPVKAEYVDTLVSAIYPRIGWSGGSYLDENVIQYAPVRGVYIPLACRFRSTSLLNLE